MAAHVCRFLNSDLVHLVLACRPWDIAATVDSAWTFGEIVRRAAYLGVTAVVVVAIFLADTCTHNAHAFSFCDDATFKFSCPNDWIKVVVLSRRIFPGISMNPRIHHQ